MQLKVILGEGSLHRFPQPVSVTSFIALTATKTVVKRLSMYER